ncbi:MAG: DUF86 domain-containing protein [Sulfuritalea sp.]|nr:DUF86 domain-containing protein [Sulfuritalea sp.]
MQRDWQLFLEDMTDCCRKLVDYRHLTNRTEFDMRGMAFDAIVRNVEVLGEAAGKLPEHVRNAAPKVPWEAIIGMRHRIAHAYFGIDPDILWDVVEHEVPLLIEELHKLKTRIDSGEISLSQDKE